MKNLKKLFEKSITEEHELDEYLNSFNESGNDSILAFEQPRPQTWSAPISRPDNKYQFQLSRSPPKNRTTDKARFNDCNSSFNFKKFIKNINNYSSLSFKLSLKTEL